MACELCERELELTKHHLIPKEVHNKKWCQRMFSKIDRHYRTALVCQDCHSAIHKFLTNKELAQHYNTVELLLSHQKIKKFVDWVSKDIKRKFKY